MTDDMDKFFQYGVCPSTRTVYMGSMEGGDAESGVDAKMAEFVIKGLHLLDNLDYGSHEIPITILQDNPGGCFYHGIAIYDAIMVCRTPVVVVSLGHVMSMGAIIFQAATMRLMSPNATMMIHYGESFYAGGHQSVQRFAKEDQRTASWMEDIFLSKIREKHPDFKKKTLEEWLKADMFITAEEAVKWNLADGIYTGQQLVIAPEKGSHRCKKGTCKCTKKEI